MYYVEKTQMQRNYIRWGEPTNLQSSKSWVYEEEEEEQSDLQELLMCKKKLKPIVRNIKV